MWALNTYLKLKQPLRTFCITQIRHNSLVPANLHAVGAPDGLLLPPVHVGHVDGQVAFRLGRVEAALLGAEMIRVAARFPAKVPEEVTFMSF